ncbi:hypothetical protein CVT24_006850 [Panaeolus cyanescens]|uniref:Uncharacterized protein n=1 Tax=Panaeolus cyanescens TaxID=181874 RepID=A0A409YS04_9AGAR|nr:hypothetical protein CVT24_006850 [Panaeolus cyanescens]
MFTYSDFVLDPSSQFPFFKISVLNVCILALEWTALNIQLWLEVLSRLNVAIHNPQLHHIGNTPQENLHASHPFTPNTMAVDFVKYSSSSGALIWDIQVPDLNTYNLDDFMINFVKYSSSSGALIWDIQVPDLNTYNLDDFMISKYDAILYDGKICRKFEGFMTCNVF